MTDAYVLTDDHGSAVLITHDREQAIQAAEDSGYHLTVR